MQVVTIVNRTSKDLEGIWDGRHYTIPVGKSSYPVVQAEAFKRQNPVMGSEDPRTLQVDYLIGIEDYKDPCDPIEQSNSVERWDRKQLGPQAQNVDVVAGRTGVYSARDVSTVLPALSSTHFDKP